MLFLLKHLILIIFLLFCLYFTQTWLLQAGFAILPCFSYRNIVKRMGFWKVLLLYTIRSCYFTILPFMIFNLLGFLFFNPFSAVEASNKGFETEFQEKFRRKFLCFRIVTKGKQTNLIFRTLNKNLETCMANLSKKNFILQLVTDRPLEISNNLPKKYEEFVQEIRVPESYQTFRGSLFKSRALQYCLDNICDQQCPDCFIGKLFTISFFRNQ